MQMFYSMKSAVDNIQEESRREMCVSEGSNLFPTIVLMEIINQRQIIMREILILLPPLII